MTPRRVFRYVPFTIAQDERAEPTYEAECVSGDEAGCGAESGPHHDPAPVEEWMRRHAQETGHLNYWRCFADNAVMEPSQGLTAQLTLSREADLRPNSP